MLEAIAWILVVSAVIAALVWLRVREGRFLKKSTKDAIRPELRREFEHEVEDAMRRKGAFQDALKRFGPKE